VNDNADPPAAARRVAQLTHTSLASSHINFVSTSPPVSRYVPLVRLSFVDFSSDRIQRSLVDKAWFPVLVL
jgi:hypothetical protein